MVTRLRSGIGVEQGGAGLMHPPLHLGKHSNLVGGAPKGVLAFGILGSLTLRRAVRRGHTGNAGRF